MSSHSKVDMAALAIANCRFISPPDADLAVITTREQQQQVGPRPWIAHMVRTVDGARTLFLCASGPTPEKAVCELLAKSADAARNHIRINGYALPRGLNNGPSKGSNDHDDSSLSDSCSTVDSLAGDGVFASSSRCESLSDNETVSITSVAEAKKTKRKGAKGDRKPKDGSEDPNGRLPRPRSRSGTRGRSASRSRSRSRSRSCSSSSSGSDDYETRSPMVWGPPPPVPFDFSIRPVGPGNFYPAPAHTSWPPHMPGMPRMGRGPFPPGPAQSPTGQAPNLPNTQGLALHDVLIRIHWVGRGHVQVLKRLIANQQNLRSAALAYVRRSPDAFSGAQPSDLQALKMPMGSRGGVHLLASLRSVSVGGDQVDLRQYQGDNLGAFIQEAQDARAGLPKFEIDVSVCSPPPPPPPAPPASFPYPADKGSARHASALRVVGDC